MSMNRRENMLAFLNHEKHDHVPNFITDVCGVGGDNELFENGPKEGGYDGFGCLWHKTASANGAGVPAANHIVLTDVTEWKKQVKFPKFEEFDWEGAAKAQLARADRNNQIVEYGFWNGQFLRLMHLMGFEEGLIAMYEEPEACAELLDAITDYRIKTLEYAVKYFKPDVVTIYDDVATERGLFMSLDTYKKLIAPTHKKFFDAAKSLGVIPNLHVCGKCEDMVPTIVEEGAHAWEICQPENDLVRLGKELGDKLAFIGGYDMIGEFAYKDATEEELRKSVRDTIDAYAPQGNFGIMAMIMMSDMEKFGRYVGILTDEAMKYGTNYYL
ncbi:MAG: hypothetical protein IKM61_04350 [Eubacteriaceae bacterium]|nr:hypothetical protein [Eubacteriaceae bacterium]